MCITDHKLRIIDHIAEANLYNSLFQIIYGYLGTWMFGQSVLPTKNKLGFYNIYGSEVTVITQAEFYLQCVCVCGMRGGCSLKVADCVGQHGNQIHPPGRT